MPYLFISKSLCGGVPLLTVNVWPVYKDEWTTIVDPFLTPHKPNTVPTTFQFQCEKNSLSMWSLPAGQQTQNNLLQ